ncbi:MAG TPA: response regulator [Dyella sp.]|uniref:response regulator n=1 Tax=Dyella sp. TaxID=1869338 RepID=UPI002D794900|nr:response regulator [Dyella sp.]HET6552490.1 response regulator [Dyella sp.]
MISQPSLTILLVEDDDGIRTIATLLLESEGHQVIAMANGDLACEWLKDERPDVLFADINMPGAVNGMELARRARLAYPSLNILLTSGEAAPDPAWTASGGHYLNKPYDRRALLAALQATIQSAA